MPVPTEMWIAFGGQSIAIAVMIFSGYVKTKVSLARSEMRCDQIHANTEDLKADHKRLATKVDGISLVVAQNTVLLRNGARNAQKNNH
jgi:hypothetical protein